MELEFELDGQRYSLDVEPRISALRVIRELCARKDIVSGCAPQGVCGACMVFVAEKPRLLCTLRAKNLHGKKIKTLESLSTEEKSDWISIFSACGAAPCGLCTPALLLKSQSMSQFELTPEQQDKALQMHMCRCMSWSNLKKAVNQKSDTVATPYDGAHQLRMIGTMKRVADFRLQDMVFARPLFAPYASFQIDAIESDHTYLQTEESRTSSAADICALVYGDEAWYRQNIGVVLGAPLSIPPEERKDSAVREKSHTDAHVVRIEIPFSDSGILEPESVFVDWVQKKIFISGQSPHTDKTSLTVYSLPGAANFGGQATPDLIEWAHRLAQKEQKSVLLSLQLSDSFRVRKKRASQIIDAHISQSDDFHIEAKMGMGKEGDSFAQRIWESAFDKPYIWKNSSMECTRVYSADIATSLQRGLSLEGITAARECALDARAQREGKDPFSIRASLLPRQLATRLWSCQQTYLAHKKEGVAGLAVSSTPLGVGLSKAVEVSIVVRSEASVEIHTGFWDPMVQQLMKERLKQRIHLPEETISVVCGTEHPCWSGPSIADRDRWLGMSALDDAIECFLNVASVMPELSLFVGQCFTGSYSSKGLFGGWSFAVAIASGTDDIEKISLYVDIGEEPNLTWANAHIHGAAQQAFSLFHSEGFVYDEKGIPPLLLQKMGITKAKHSPVIDVQTYSSKGCVSFADAAYCATYAAIAVAQKRRES